LSALLQQGKGRVKALSSDTLQASSCQIGDEVMIEIPDSTLLGGTLWLYGSPLMLATGFSLWAASWGDLWAASAFCLGLVSGFAILRQLSYRFQGRLPGMAEPRLASKDCGAAFRAARKTVTSILLDVEYGHDGTRCVVCFCFLGPVRFRQPVDCGAA
jgi:hypothetical protein